MMMKLTQYYDAISFLVQIFCNLTYIESSVSADVVIFTFITAATRVTAVTAVTATTATALTGPN